ncbi:MAG: hypothetical protein ABI586_11840, partial [Candidatus Nanopelagicales bacterium]
MADFGAGLTPYTFAVDMRRADDTHLRISRLPENNPICAGRRITIAGGVAGVGTVYTAADNGSSTFVRLPSSVPIHIQFKRAGTDRWVTEVTTSIAQANGN